MENPIRQELLRRWELKYRLKELEEERERLEKELFPLYIAMHNEQADVENLEAKSIRNWFLDATGKKEAMLLQERREAQTAKLNHDTVLRKLEYTKEQLVQCREELLSLQKAPAGEWFPAENKDLIVQELRSACRTAGEVLADHESMIRQVNNLIEQNKWGLNKSMMPSYLATTQKKINLLKAKIDLFVEEASNLPVRKPILKPDDRLLIIDDHLMDQTVGGLGADMLLGESYSALVASKKRIRSALEALNQEIAQLECYPVGS